MAQENTQNSFRRGVMSLVILALLKKEDMYGYQLVQEIGQRSGGRLTTQEGSLYPVLYKLVDQGLISDRRVQIGKRMTRVYYHLMPAGENKLREMISEYEEVTRGVFGIIEGGEPTAVESSNVAVFAGAMGEDSGELETETTGYGTCIGGSPGLCV